MSERLRLNQHRLECVHQKRYVGPAGRRIQDAFRPTDQL